MRNFAFSALIVLLISCKNGEMPSQTEVHVQHQLLLYDSIGVDTGDSLYLFGDVWGSAYTHDGRIAVLDRMYNGIKYYSQQCVYLESFQPVGQGPGEFTALDRMVSGDQGMLILGSYYDHKVALYAGDRTLIREIAFTNAGRRGPIRLQAGRDSSFVVSSFVTPCEDSVGTEIALFKESEVPSVVYRTRLVRYSDGINYQAQTAMSFGTAPDGRVYIADNGSDSYTVVCYSAEGDSLFSFSKDSFSPIAKPDSVVEQEMARALQSYTRYHGSPEGFDYTPNPYYLSVTSISVDGNGRVWVRGESDLTTADLFTADGDFLYSVEFLPPSWQTCDGWNFRVGWFGGVLADPRNPESCPIVYLLEEVSDTTRVLHTD